MKRLALILLAILLISASTDNGSASAKETWLSVRSKNFLLIGNAGEKEIRKVGVRLEQFRDVFSRIFTRSKANSAIPITVIVFKDDNAYKPYKPIYQGKPAAVSGYFQPAEDVNYITLTAEFREINPYAVIFHEYVHALTSDNAKPLPPWVSEGIAEYYSSFEVESNEKKVWLGKAIANHVLYLREQKFLPLQRLFEVTHGSPEYNERDRKGVFYAQSWALVHYLLLGENGKWNAPFRQFVNALASGRPVDESFKQSFQTDYATIEKALREYIGRSAYPAQFVTFDDKLSFDADLQTRPLSEAEVQFYLGDLLWRIRRPDEGAEYLKRAIALDPKLAPALASLGILSIRQDRFTEARQYLEQAAAANSKNHLAHYYHAYAIYRELYGERQLVAELPEDKVNAMRASLDQAIVLASDFPESYNLLAYIALATGQKLDTAVNAVKKAMSIAPGREHYVMTLAQLYLRLEKFAEARQAATTLARGASQPELRSRAESLLRTIAQIEQYKAQLKEREERIETPATTATADPSAPPPPPPVMRRRFEDEKAKGLLTRVDCDDKGLTMTLKSADRIFKFHTAAPDRVQFITYTESVGKEFTCGPLNPARPVIITYRGATDAKSKFDGEPVAVEFLKF